jgi:hypothetical protein
VLRENLHLESLNITSKTRRRNEIQNEEAFKNMKQRIYYKDLYRGNMLKQISNNNNNINNNNIVAKSDEFILDSGASMYVFHSLEQIEGLILLSIKEFDNNNNIQVLNSNNYSSNLHGISGIPIVATHKGYIQGMGQFLIVPDANQNLISIPMSIKLEIYEILFDGKSCHLNYKNVKESLIVSILNDD